MGNVLLKEIEECREEMIELSVVHGLTSEVVVNSSKKLDNLLNEYQKITQLSDYALVTSK